MRHLWQQKDVEVAASFDGGVALLSAIDMDRTHLIEDISARTSS
jgi:hypothetical protein